MEDLQEQPEPQVADVERPNITLHDIAAVVQILDVCTSRAVWRPQELSGVGKIYDRLTAFLQGAGYNMEPAADQEEPQGQ